MKKIYIFLFFFIFQIASSQVYPIQNEKLVATCKVWGFLKYYHPKVAAGNLDWNNELISFLPKVEETKTKEEFSKLLENWVNSLGDIPKITPTSPIEKIEYFDKNFDLSWINKNKLISKSLSKKLSFIEKNRYLGEQYYVGSLRAENIFIKNEDYTKFDSQDKSQRIRALFTYWNLIEYFFPYKYLMDTKWDNTLYELLPEFINAKNDNEFYLTFQKLVASLNDSHTVFVRYKAMPKYYLPVFGKIIDEKIVITKVLNRDLTKTYDIKIGDVISKINNKTIAELIAKNRKTIGSSNQAGYHYKLIEPLLSSREDTIKIELLKKNKTINKVINWTNYRTNKYVSMETIKDSSRYKEKYKIIGNNIGYVDMNILKVKYIPEMIEKLKSTQAIIFDIRNYPNGTFEEISNFLNSKEKVFAIYTKPVLNYPGRFKWTQGTSTGIDNPNYYRGKVVVLVDEESISQSEWTAMCFQTAENTTIIGSQTCGADGNIVSIDYMPAFHSSFSGIGVYYPDKRETQRIGIIPDIEIKPTIKGIQEGRDEVLERALEFIKTGK